MRLSRGASIGALEIALEIEDELEGLTRRVPLQVLPKASGHVRRFRHRRNVGCDGHLRVAPEGRGRGQRLGHEDVGDHVAQIAELESSRDLRLGDERATSHVDEHRLLRSTRRQGVVVEQTAGGRRVGQEGDEVVTLTQEARELRRPIDTADETLRRLLGWATGAPVS